MSNVSIGYILVAAFVCVALASIIGGVVLVGTPAEQRLKALDNKRVHHLNLIARKVRDHQTKHGRLPESLADISDEWVSQVADPETGEPYTYRVTGERSFQLCAVFVRKDNKPRKPVTYFRFKMHEQGLHCFDRKVVPRDRR